MAHLLRSLKFVLAFTFVATSGFAEPNYAPPCFRLEGMKMDCAGGGVGEQCTESCAGKCGDEIANTCQGAGSGCFVCEGTSLRRQCTGTKCCFEEKCTDSYRATFCGPRSVCGQTCEGTMPVDCSARSCTVWDVIEGTKHQETIPGECGQVGYRCGAGSGCADGGTCSCELTASGTACQARAGSCASCNCGNALQQFCQSQNPPTYVCTDVPRCRKARAIPMISDGTACGCKCPQPSDVPPYPVCETAPHCP